MRKFLLSCTLATTLLFSTACSWDNTVDAVDTVTSAVTIDYMYSNGEAVNYLDNAKLTDEETDIVLNALINIDNHRKDLQKYEDNPILVLTDLLYIEVKYNSIKDSYLEIRNIAIAHQSEYSLSEWNTFVVFDEAIKKLDSKASKLIAAVQNKASRLAAANTVLNIANTAVRLGAIL